MKLLRKILFPFNPLYYSVVFLRNKCFDFGIFKSKSYQTPIICVGNLSVGGTGKTPMIEALIQLLQKEYNVAVLSRGYGRQSKDLFWLITHLQQKFWGMSLIKLHKNFQMSLL